MSIRMIAGIAAAAVVLTFAAGAGFTEDKPAPKPMSEQELFAKVMELSTPGAMHKNVLPRFVGSWKVAGKTITMMGDIPITGTAESTSIIGGRYVQMRYEGPFMGGAFEGAGHIAYDNFTKSFQRTWCMTMSSSIEMLTGTWDEKATTLTWRGEIKAPDGTTHKKRETIVFSGADKFVATTYSTGADGKEKMLMVLNYTRIAKDAK